MRDPAGLIALSDYTTLRLGGPAARFSRAGSQDEVCAAVRDADQAGQPLLVLGGGSNVVIADAGFDGAVVQVASRGVQAHGSGDRIEVQVQAGENWADLVDWAVADKLSGIECLAGIPGLAGATPIQNVGAYGQEISQVLASVLALDRRCGETVMLRPADCEFGYRTSLFKRARYQPSASLRQPVAAALAEPVPGSAAGPAPTGWYVVLAVTLVLGRSPMSAPIAYAELAATLGVAPGERAPLAAAREAVLELRRGKGMVLDPADPDTRSAGSFFTNPVLGERQFAALRDLVAQRFGPARAVPHFPAAGGNVKIPAAWLIERAGFTRGYPGVGGARISTKHTLALTNPGGATTAGLMALAGEIRSGVRDAFGIELAAEPVLVGASWGPA